MDAMQEILLYIKFTLFKVFSPSTFKVLSVFAYVLYSFAFDMNQKEAHIALLALIALDFITGIMSAKISGEAIRSAKIRHSAVKVFAYFSVIAGAHMAEKGLVTYISFIDETVLAFFLITELISLIENVGKMGYETPKKILNQARDIQKKFNQ